jgi:nucleoid-associated protein YgaU
MFDSKSRYAKIADSTLTLRDLDGETREIRYKLRRFLPPLPDPAATLAYTVAQGDRPDLLSARFGGDPLQFWRLTDANLVRRPKELTSQPGYSIRIPIL